MLWIDSIRPAKPVIQKQSDSVWKIAANNEKRLKYFILYSLPGNQTEDAVFSSIFEILSPTRGEVVFNKNEHKELCNNGCAVSVMNRNNLESDVEVLK